jgi:hypothetical protein
MLESYLAQFPSGAFARLARLKIDELKRQTALAPAPMPPAAQGNGAGDKEVIVLRGKLEAQQRISEQALAQVELLNQQIAALRRQIGALEEALNASEARNR